MKLVMDEKLKHRLIGIAVILSIATIFTPAIIKKSNQRFDPKVTMSVKLPPKPLQPKVAEVDEKQLFQTTNVAQVELPNISEDDTLPETVKAEYIEPTNQFAGSTAHEIVARETAPAPIKNKVIKTASVNKPSLQISAQKTQVAQNAPLEINTKSIKSVKSQRIAKINKRPLPSNQKEYAIQVASFSVQQNAVSLMNHLKAKGYSARISKMKYKNGHLYKVHVGHVANRKQAENLKTQLADNLNLKGFIINTGVS